uniref:Endonuclease n=1 Tax=Pseudomonas phage Pavpe01 TaxID=3138545 RepID=A0AAU6VZU6_9VIRU
MTQQATGWRDQTRQLLKNRPRTLAYETIAAETGLSVPWLRAFAAEQSDNPGVVYVETLYVYLSNYKG